MDRRAADLLKEAPMDTIMIERLTGHSTPTRLPVEGNSGREERNWAVRLTGNLPTGRGTDDLVAKVTEAAIAAVREARTARGLDPAAKEGEVSVRIHAVDARHAIVGITTVRLDKDDAHAWLVAASAALRALDGSVPVEDIQGIPRRFWKLLVGP